MKPAWERLLRKKILLKAPHHIKDNIDQHLPSTDFNIRFLFKPSLAIFASIVIILGIWSYQSKFNLPNNQINSLIGHITDYELYESLELFTSYDVAELDEQDWEILLGENI